MSNWSQWWTEDEEWDEEEEYGGNYGRRIPCPTDEDLVRMQDEAVYLMYPNGIPPEDEAAMIAAGSTLDFDRYRQRT